MQLTKVVTVDDARVAALTPEAFRLVLEARGWMDWPDGWVHGPSGAMHNPDTMSIGNGLRALTTAHHNGSTFDAFTEVERVQALLSAVEAAGRGEWDRFGETEGVAEGVVIRLTDSGAVLGGRGALERLEVDLWPEDDEDPHRAAREARAQLPRLVRIICGVEDG